MINIRKKKIQLKSKEDKNIKKRIGLRKKKSLTFFIEKNQIKWQQKLHFLFFSILLLGIFSILFNNIFGIIIRRKFTIYNSNKKRIGFFQRNNIFNYLIITFHDFHIIGLLLFIFIGVLLFGIIIFTIKERRKIFNHNATMESWWIFFPTVILGRIAIPSISILYSLEDVATSVYGTFKATGHQWYWTYDFVILPHKHKYPIQKEFFIYDRYMKKNPEKDFFRNLSSYGPLYLKSFEHIRGLITSKDVIHRWALPSIRIKVDAIPGRLNQIELMNDEGNVTIYGQCSELCGVNHRFIPIAVKIKR